MPNSSGAIDLSALRSKKTEGPAIDDLSPEQREALAAMADEECVQEAVACRTAFVVFVSEEGQTVVTGDLDMAFMRSALPTMDDIYAACAVIQKDIVATQSAQSVMMGMQQTAIAARQAAENSQLLSQLRQQGLKV